MGEGHTKNLESGEVVCVEPELHVIGPQLGIQAATWMFLLTSSFHIVQHHFAFARYFPVLICFFFIFWIYVLVLASNERRPSLRKPNLISLLTMSTNSTNHVSVLDSSPILGHEDTPVPASNTSENTPLLAHEETTRTRRPPSGFTLRAVRIGLAIGALICPTTLYFGLQTGHITGYPLAMALICKCWCPSLTVPENVVVVAVATTIAAMPMVTALVGIIPALIYLVEPEEGGALQLGWLQLQLWSVGVCFFGTFRAMRLRGYFVVRSELQFPMAEATALVIRGCHGGAGELDLGSSERADGVDVEANSNGAEELKSSTPRLESGMKELVISGLVSMIWVSAN